jgi:hypothetical protein
VEEAQAATGSVEEAGASHPSSIGSKSEAGQSDASAGNGATGGAQIQADAAEQLWASRRPGASVAEDYGRWQSIGVPPCE